MKYRINATVTVTLEEVPVTLDGPASEELDFEDALLQKLNEKLVLLDIRGGRSGGNGLITSMECDSVDSWEAD